MVALPVIPFTFRVRLDWDSVSGVKPVNIFHVSGPWTTAAEVAEDLSDSYNDNMWRGISSSWGFSTHSITPLDGVTATQTFTVPAHSIGMASGQSIINLSCLLEFTTLVRGSRGRGKLFLGPTTETINTGSNAIDVTTRGQIDTGWSAFQAALLALPGGGASIVVASYVHAEANPIQSITVDGLLRSTKSRLNQITR